MKTIIRTGLLALAVIAITANSPDIPTPVVTLAVVAGLGVYLLRKGN